MKVCTCNMASKPKSRSSRRDDFSAKVLMILYKRAGGKCCRCGAPTFGPDTNPHKSVNIGQGAHIAAAAEGGPRYNSKMTTEERSSATNGMWLCSNCHDIIDRDVREYPITKLKKMKREAEERARREVGVARDPMARGNGDVDGSLTSGVSAATIVEIRKHKSSLAQLNNQTIDDEEGLDYLDRVDFIDFDKDEYLPDVGRELLSYLQQLVVSCPDPSVQMEVIRRLKSMCDAFKNQFNAEDVENATLLVKLMAKRSSKNKRSRLYQSAVALLKDLAVEFKGKGAAPAKEIESLKIREETDAPPPAKQARLDKEAEQPMTEEDIQQINDDHYLDVMKALSECTDVEQALKLEAELIEMGYEPNVV